MVNFDKSTLIVSHPDDECLFASSLLNKISTLIICFGNIPYENKISIGRKKAIKHYPLKNIKVINLDLSQSIKSFYPINWYRVIDKKSGIKRGYKEESYDKNYDELLDKLRNLIPKDGYLFTHNPWGEYGHGEHCQVFKACFTISKETRSQLYVTGYVSQLSKHYAKIKTHLISPKILKFETNKRVYNLLKKHYTKYDCWTWDPVYKIPKIEFFYKVNLSYDSKSIITKNNCLNIPLIKINHHNPLIYIIRKIIKIFVPSLLQNFFNKCKLFIWKLKK